ncbi:cupin 2 domain-containing protein [Paraburkholderia sp. GAS199]|uniref:cupin domain-containing protein n=1 Tax=Paraburkholderia sp. GAS199 TaxID=3035126 RepID=UPI003D20C7B9
MQPESGKLISGNLFDLGAATGAGEYVETLLQRDGADGVGGAGGISVERIVSTGQASPPGFWYDDPRAEWVVLLSGAAALEFEGAAELHRMQPGDHVLIEAHRRHRVAWTSDTAPSVWLAVYCAEAPHTASTKREA